MSTHLYKIPFSEIIFKSNLKFSLVIIFNLVDVGNE